MVMSLNVIANLDVDHVAESMQLHGKTCDWCPCSLPSHVTVHVARVVDIPVAHVACLEENMEATLQEDVTVCPAGCLPGGGCEGVLGGGVPGVPGCGHGGVPGGALGGLCDGIS